MTEPTSGLDMKIRDHKQPIILDDHMLRQLDDLHGRPELPPQSPNGWDPEDR